VREISDNADLAAASHGDTLCAWAAQGLAGRSRAWLSDDGRALAVAGPALATRDRLVLRGDPAAAVPLVREVLAEVGPSYRPLGEAALIDEIAGRIPGLTRVARFGWMDCTRPGPPAPGPGPVQWLPEDGLAPVADLLAASYPSSYATPGGPGVERWAGVRGSDGQLDAVGALAWSAPAVGFMAGVAARPAARGQGLGRQVCRFLVAGALARHEAAALMVDDGNHAALRLYRDLGLRYRQLAAAAIS
jgi:GNAT superfamily N-acetyltransferase